MSQIKMFVCMMLVIIPLSNYEVKAAGRSSTSYEPIKEVELERQLKTLNKSPIITIQTTEGHTFDCIDIYKQPALENPLLHDHKIQMRPSSPPPKGLINKKDLSSSKLNKPYVDDVLKRLNCPKGSVPIRRTTKEELRNTMALSKSIDSTNIIHPATTYAPGVHLAYWRTKDGATDILHGAKGIINVANPKVANDQYSGAQIWIEAGPFKDVDTIQVGWAVAPSLYGDNQTHLTTYWRGFGKNGCYNIICPGFVQVDKDFALGDTLSRISKYGGIQFVMNTYVYQDKGTGDWWLNGGSEEKNIGYWPKQLFTHLSNGATRVAWGGIVKGTPNGPSPQMGNGQFPLHSYWKSSFVTHLKIVTEHYDLVNSNEYYQDLQAFVESECYKLEYDGYKGKIQEISILFGGPGGNNCGN